MIDTDRTLRQQLAASPPHVSMKSALRALIRALRSAGRTGDSPRHVLASRAALERCLGRVHPVAPEDLVAVKAGLHAVLANGEGATQQAERVADRLLALAPVPLEPDQMCRLRVVQRPPQVSRRVLQAILGCEEGSVRAEAAARAMHRVHGLVLGGQEVRLQVECPPGRCLPALSREQRVDRGRWGRGVPWLAHLDDVGRMSLTPRSLAVRIAQRVLPIDGNVLDACCGCGGNAVAFALAGAQVTAFELDANRARLARRNIRAQGLEDRVVVRTGTVEDHLDEGPKPGDLLFVDPPWIGGDGVLMVDFPSLLSSMPRLASAILVWPTVVLKLPRAFDVQTLPGGADAWSLHYELGTADHGDAHIVRMITAIRRHPPI